MDELPRIAALVEKIVVVYGERHRDLAVVATCFAEVCGDLWPHLVKEEWVLFPMEGMRVRRRYVT